MKGKWVFIAASALVLTVEGAAAQIPGFNITLFPRVGLFKPSSDLGTFGGNAVELRGGTAVGLSAELGLPLLPNIRANLDYAMGVGTSSGGVNSPEEDNSVMMLTADLVLDLTPGISPIRPYLLAGGGVKRYEFDPSLGGATKDSDFTIHVGGGVGFKAGPLQLVGEASDYISWFKPASGGSGKMQNDLFIMAGFKIGMF